MIDKAPSQPEPARSAPEKPLAMGERERLTFGANVRIARGAKGWTQAQLAEAAGTSQGTIAKIEQGSMGMTLRLMTCVATALNMPVHKTLI